MFFYLDQDNWYENNHVESCVRTIEDLGLDWCYSLRSIYDKDEKFLVNDDCESLGKWPVFSGDYNHIDTNCYCIKTEIATKVCQVWHGGWGQDRAFLNILHNAFKKFDTTGLYTLNYRMGGGTNAVKSDFFVGHNTQVEKHYNGELPWRKI